MTDEPHTEENLIVDRRVNGYAEVEKKLDDHAVEIRERFAKWFRVSLLAFVVVGLTSVIAIVGYGLVIKDQARITRDIQDQRREATLDACLATNKRHAEAVGALKEGSDEDIRNAPNDDVRKEIARRAAVTTGLIDALVPVVNCNKLVAKRVKGTG